MLFPLDFKFIDYRLCSHNNYPTITIIIHKTRCIMWKFVSSSGNTYISEGESEREKVRERKWERERVREGERGWKSESESEWGWAWGAVLWSIIIACFRKSKTPENSHISLLIGLYRVYRLMDAFICLWWPI